jgi:diguanylate cyclase (GGDEF)-like protein
MRWPCAYHEELHRLSTVDGLTQTFNKRCFLDRLKQKVNNVALDSRASSLVAVKLILSGTYDDEEADTTLRALVRELKSLVRPEDLLGRYSDNVLIIFSEQDCERTRSFCEEFVSRTTQSKDAPLARSGVSIGLVDSSGTRDTTMVVKDAIRRAEAACRLGMNRIVDYAVPLSDTTSNNLQSTFISYGGPDHAFAKKLNEFLKLRGVQTFFFQDDAPPGDKLHDVMREGVNAHDRVILVCSKASLERRGLLNELEETLAREARDGGATYLLPIRLDDYVINEWRPSKAGLAQTIRDRVIADFRDHEDPAAFASAIARVMAALTRQGK